MSQEETRPKIRMGLDFFPLLYEGRRMIGIRDPQGVSEETILVLPHVFFILSLMDGQNTLSDMEEAFQRQFNEKIPEGHVAELAMDLDDRGFMDTPVFQEKMRRVEEAYLRDPVRPSALAGRAYPDDQEEVISFLNGHFEGLEKEGSRDGFQGEMAGIIAPHIDLHRGGHLFATAYDRLRYCTPPKTAIIFGTAHFGDGGPYILTDKDFETPLGIARADRNYCEALLSSCGSSLRKGEWTHRSEHSVEFQVLLLQHVFGAEQMPRIVPLLCSSVMELLPSGASPQSLPEVAAFLNAAREAMNRSDGPVLVVAGADMCHVGAKFGTPERIAPDYLERVRREDEDALSQAADLDPEGFYQSIFRIQNRNNICSVTSIYTLLKILEGCRGERLSYDMAVDEENDSAVGFAAMNFWRD